MELQVRQSKMVDHDGYWHVALVGGNDEVMMFSENYFDKGNAVRAANAIAKAFNDDMEYLDVEVKE